MTTFAGIFPVLTDRWDIEYALFRWFAFHDRMGLHRRTLPWE